jgi:predicted signal transduction protein with EAL and GGDEF domain
VGLVIVAQPARWTGLAGQLLQQADAAMYQAKQAGKGRVVVIDAQDPPAPETEDAQSNTTRNA